MCPSADNLQIAGLVPVSSVDWPAHLTATVFLQGCPWNCFYCHNQALIPSTTPGAVAWAQVRELLCARRGLLDGVVFSGGEALRQADLIAAAQEVKALGFLVGLHTAGAYPQRLKTLVSAELVDWVGLDVKALPEHYAAVIGRGGGAQKVSRSLEILLNSAVPFEVRTTVVDGDVTAHDAFALAQNLQRRGVQVYALQQARLLQKEKCGFAPPDPQWDAQCQALAQQIESLGWQQFTYRPAY